MEGANQTALTRYMFVESAEAMVRDCRSGLPDRRSFCLTATIIGAFSAICMPAVVLIGAMGNWIVAQVMLLRLRPLTRQNLYIGCIAIADLLTCLFPGIFNFFLTKGLAWISGGRFAFYLYNLSDTWCKVHRFAVRSLYSLSTMWLLALVVDRFLVVYRPLMMRKLGIRWAMGGLATALVITILINLPNALLVGNNYLKMPNNNNLTLIYCFHFSSASVFMIVFKIILTNPPTLFIGSILLLNVLMVLKIIGAVKRRRTLTSGQPRGRNELRGTITVLILSFLYLMFNIPLIVFRPLLDVSMDLMDRAENLDYLSRLADLVYTGMALTLVNQCTTVFVLMSRSAVFEKSALKMLCICGLRRGQPDSIANRSSEMVPQELGIRAVAMRYAEAGEASVTEEN